jgi:hypothetical protein
LGRLPRCLSRRLGTARSSFLEQKNGYSEFIPLGRKEHDNNQQTGSIWDIM